MPMSLAFLWQVQVKILILSENSCLLRDMMNFNEIFGKNLTYDDIKSD